jgi:hypothetical protein
MAQRGSLDDPEQSSSGLTLPEDSCAYLRAESTEASYGGGRFLTGDSPALCPPSASQFA